MFFYILSFVAFRVKSLLHRAFCAVRFLVTARVMKPSGSDEKDGGGWWGTYRIG
jgi:hypothetical protein